MYFRSLSFISLLPFLLLLTVVFILSVPHNFLFFGNFTPLYCLIIVYYWYLLFPATLPLVLLFVFGVLQDVLLGTPIGLSSISLILFQLFVDYYKKFLVKKSFNIVWLGFVLCSLYAILLQTLIIWIFLSSSWAQVFSLLQQWYFSCLLYPAMHHIFDLMTNKLKIVQTYNAH